MGLTATDDRPLAWTGTRSADLGHVFVSHSRWDRSEAYRLTAWLRAAGVPVWISGPERHCPTWPDSIFPNIASCSALVVLMSPRSEVAEGVDQELRYAQALGKPIVPLALDGWSFLREVGWPAENVASNSLPPASLLHRFPAHPG